MVDYSFPVSDNIIENSCIFPLSGIAFLVVPLKNYSEDASSMNERKKNLFGRYMVGPFRILENSYSSDE